MSRHATRILFLRARTGLPLEPLLDPTGGGATASSVWVRASRFPVPPVVASGPRPSEAPWKSPTVAPTSVHEHPTPEKNGYLVLSLDFSPVNTDGDAAAIQRSFTTTVEGGVRIFLMRSRDRFPEKVLKLMLLACISQSRMFHILSEKEFSGGYCDLFLGLNPDVPAGRYAWMLEVKYLQTQAKPAEIERAFDQAFEQLDR